MTVSVTHAKVSGIADGSDSAQVQPSDWNDDHVVSGAAGYAYRRTSGSYTTTSNSFADVDATNLKPTIAVQANSRLRITLGCKVTSNAAVVYLHVTIAGVGSFNMTYGVVLSDGDKYWEVVTPQLSAGSYTPTLQFAIESSQTLTLFGTTTNPLQFVVEELSW